ncbi:MAG: OPT/YSL family transporter [Candidatus Thermoplasmatota archaeon]|mgnify:FL=1|uniref:OPT family oligopeptide transporter n=1 Tax=marine metagenome TaxID=408172 RepID=A0A381WGP8_9ZZZZ|nr:OPT/YSL family transporter [Candidatus Thermoplasmatota archaeon]MEE3114313.1 OPT/YSL family transporter [Candidatus Thermoplasmatota archaeon]
MPDVERSAYRRPVTASGLEAIERGTLTWLDEDMYNNLNTGVLEQYLEEKNFEESFEISHWDTRKVLIGILIGAVFSGVTAYIGLKIGLAVSAAWYVAYLLGMALQWSPSEVNIATSATTGATHASTGFIFTFPAIFLLAYSDDYKVGDGHLISSIDTLNLAFIGIIASMFAGFLGVMYFIIFRRVWLVEDPLPMPGFEATLKMLDIASDVSTGSAEAARESLKTVGIWTVLTMGLMFVIDYPISWSRKVAGIPSSIADWFAMALSGEKWGMASIYTERWLHQPSKLEDGHAPYGGITPYESDNPMSYTFLGIELSPTLFAIGWFMKFRAALLVNLGAILAWFWLIPLAVLQDVPVYDPELGVYINITDYGDTSSDPVYPIVQWKAFGSIVRTVAIGAILGGGLLGLLKMTPTFAGIFGDIAHAFTGEKGEEFVDGKGWYEWPLYHIPIFMGISFVAITLIFVVGGYPLLPSLIFSVVLLSTTFLLGAIAVRVMGETGIEPVSGTSFIVLLMLLLVFLNLDVGLTKEESVLMALVGTTVFGSAISMSGTVVGDYKNSLYIGNRPYHISKGNIMGVVPGAILGAGVAIFLSKLLAEGKIDLLAPQANAFAYFTTILAEGQGNWSALMMGMALGAFAEWATGMGTSFGLGMYLPTPATFPMLIGGAFRSWWEDRRLKPVVEAIRLEEGSAAAEKKGAQLLLFTFMIAAGALTGEAFYGVESAILAVVDESLGHHGWWPYARLVGFVMINVIVGAMIYVLFRKAGIIGQDGGGDGKATESSGVMDAELAG